MILVTRLNRTQLYINAELIQYVEETPDTVITLVNEKKIIVRESAKLILDEFVDYQRKIHQPLSSVTRNERES
jgi:flagellar protein FlbD